MSQPRQPPPLPTISSLPVLESTQALHILDYQWTCHWHDSREPTSLSLLYHSGRLLMTLCPYSSSTSRRQRKGHLRLSILLSGNFINFVFYTAQWSFQKKKKRKNSKVIYMSIHIYSHICMKKRVIEKIHIYIIFTFFYYFKKFNYIIKKKLNNFKTVIEIVQ